MLQLCSSCIFKSHTSQDFPWEGKHACRCVLVDVAEKGRSSLFFLCVMKYASLLLYQAPISFVTHRWMKALHVLRRPAERRHMRFCQNQWKCAVLMGICVFNSISLYCLDTSSKTALDMHSCCFEWWYTPPCIAPSLTDLPEHSKRKSRRYESSNVLRWSTNRLRSLGGLVGTRAMGTPC